MTLSLAPLSIIGIGSVPYQEGEDASLRIFKEWDIPFWPQYPSRSKKENFVFQFLESFPGLQVSGAPAFDESVYLKMQKEYRRRLNQAFEKRQFQAFEPSKEWALGYFQMRQLLEDGQFPEKETIKLQITGPGTVWNSFFSSRATRENQKEIQIDLFRTLAAAGLAQIHRMRSFQRQPLIFIDEPLLLGDPRPLAEMAAAFKESGAGVGLHFCSSSAADEEWARHDLNFLHFDLHVLRNTDTHFIRLLRRFLKKGGWIVWGLVPARENVKSGGEDYSGLLMEWVGRVAERALPEEAILARSLLAPACGTGLLSPLGDREIFKSLRLAAQGSQKTKIRY